MRKVIHFTAEEPARRSEAAQKALRRYMPFIVSWEKEPSYTFSITLPPEIPAEDLLLWASREGVAFSFYPDGRPNSIHFHFAHLDPEQITDGIRRLGTAIARYLEAFYTFTEGKDPFQGP